MYLCPPIDQTKLYKGRKGLKIHYSRSHKPIPTENLNKIKEKALIADGAQSNEPDQTIFKCIPCNRTFDSSKELKIHESFHEKLKVKIQSKESVRKRNISSKTSICHDENENVDVITELNEFLVLNENERNSQSSSKSSDVPVSSEFLKNRITCDCGFIAKNSRGLKIHQNTHKKKKINEQTECPTIQQDRVKQHFTSNKQDENYVDMFGILLSKCKEVIPVVRIIQKSVRSTVSLELSKVIVYNL